MPRLAPAIVQLVAAADQASARATEILRDGSYQRSLPPPFEAAEFVLPTGILGTVLRILAFTGLAVLLVLAVAFIARRLGDRALEVEEGEAPAPAAPLELPVESAEALAAEGRFGDAIHALLLDTLAALARAGRVAPSLTSREIVARVPLAPGPRDALGALVEAVEVSWFGGQVPTEVDYRLCLERFQAFAASYRRAA